MANFSIEKIEPTLVNALDMTSMTRDEVIRMSSLNNAAGLGQVLSPADQLAALRTADSTPDKKYFGAFDENERLLAFIKTNEWFYDDQVAYESVAKQVRYKLRLKRASQPMAHRPLGVFSLTTHQSLSFDAGTEAAGLLLDQAIAQADGREIRAGHYAEGVDPAKWVSVTHGFEGTGKFGFGLGVLQELHIRPADADRQANNTSDEEQA